MVAIGPEIDRVALKPVRGFAVFIQRGIQILVVMKLAPSEYQLGFTLSCGYDFIRLSGNILL